MALNKPTCDLCGAHGATTELVFFDGLDEVLEMLEGMHSARLGSVDAFGLRRSPQTSGTASPWQG